MNRVIFPMLALSGALLGACASTPRQTASDTRVVVDWSDPAKFADTRSDQCHSLVKPEEWLSQLARYTQSRARSRLQQGQSLNVTITDIQRAGQCEPWRGPRVADIRILKDIYPPSISFHFQLSDRDGKIVTEGDRKLTDLAYLQRGSLLDRNDSLRYEKRMIDDWLRKELPSR